MSYAQYLRQLLRPLRVYDLTAPFNGSELDAAGLSLDAVDGKLEEIFRESNLTTAQDWGVERVAQLLAHRPVAENATELVQALMALLRIGGDSFTLEAINDTLSGCGIPARAEEVGVGAVKVSFPTKPGEPDGFEELKIIIESILPAHVSVEYWFWYLTWSELERIFSTWGAIESRNLTWAQLELSME